MITLRLDPKLEQDVNITAKNLGLTKSEFIRKSIHEYLGKLRKPNAWDTFYQEVSQELKMFKLFQRVIQREMATNTFRPRNRALASRAFGKEV